jgi:hypothetical protein
MIAILLSEFEIVVSLFNAVAFGNETNNAVMQNHV